MIKIIKKLVILELVLIVVGAIVSVVTESYLPLELQEYLNGQYEQELTIIEMVPGIFGLVLLIALMVSLIGILLTKIWARKLFILTSILLIPCFLFIGPIVFHAVSYVLDQITVFVQGMLFCVLIFNDSYQKHALKKSENKS